MTHQILPVRYQNTSSRFSTNSKCKIVFSTLYSFRNNVVSLALVHDRFYSRKDAFCLKMIYNIHGTNVGQIYINYLFYFRFCVGDRYYLCNNKILCEYDYEERMVFASMSYNYSALSQIKRQAQSLSDDVSSGYGSPSPSSL